MPGLRGGLRRAATARASTAGSASSEPARDAGRWNLRPYGAGLLDTAGVSTSMVVFVLLLLSTVTFDGFTATPAWAALDGRALRGAGAAGRRAAHGHRHPRASSSFPLLFVAVYLGCSPAGWPAWAATSLSTATVARLFVLSLVPIAIAYHLAHYFTYLLIQGQLLIRLASDPLGLGWNLFGTARYRPDIGIVGARAVWYTAVVAIVMGHVIAVYVAHVVALREYPDRRAALRSQLPMLRADGGLHGGEPLDHRPAHRRIEIGPEVDLRPRAGSPAPSDEHQKGGTT